MQKVKVYDLPTRVFHLFFGVLFATSFLIGKFIDDESAIYAYHMLSGLMMVFMVILRIIWGIIGSKYAKFSSFKLNPKDLVKYFKNVLSGKTKRELGHNPASSFAAILMFLLTFSLVGTGLLMVNGVEKEFFEEIHELFAFSFLLIVIAHITGVLIHQLRHDDGMAFSMFNGTKKAVDGQLENDRNSPVVLVIFLLLVIGFSANLLKNLDSQSGSLNLFGKQLQLVENEHHKKYNNEYYDMEDDHDDD